MMIRRESTAVVLAIATFLMGSVACQRQEDAAEKGAAQKAGEKIDQATTQAGENINKAGEQVGKAMQKAGEKGGEAAQKAGEKMEGASKDAEKPQQPHEAQQPPDAQKKE
jgi:hypothetical protein